MKYNNKLNLVTYLQIIDDMVREFFDPNTYEYTPQVGEIYSVCLYFNNCVELEDVDDIKVNHIADLMDMEPILNNKELMHEYREEISGKKVGVYLTFGDAYAKAKDIVEYKKNDANSFANAISSSMDAILKSFRESFSDKDISDFIDIARQITSGKLSGDAILKAYENSDRFKEENAQSEPLIIPFMNNKSE